MRYLITGALFPLILMSCGTMTVNPMEGTEIWTVQSGGVQRMVLVHPPVSGGENLPVLLVFHGGYGTAQGAEKSYRVSELADRENFIAVYPQGLNRHWNDGRIDPENLTDVAFVETILDSLESRFQIDTERIYATGMSNGAMFCHFLSVKMPGILAGIAPVCGGIADPGVSWFQPEEPMDVLIIQGAEDPLVPYQGGEIGSRGDRGRVLGTPEAVDLWREVNGCNESPATSMFPQGSVEDHCNAVFYLYGGIRDVGLVGIEGGGHVWPGGEQYLSERVVGRACTDFSGAEFIWRFFKEAEERKDSTEPVRSSQDSHSTGGRI